MTKKELYELLKIESVKLIIQNRFFESKLILDCICYVESCIFNNKVIFDKLLLNRLEKYDRYLYNMLVGFLEENKIKIGE